MSARPPSCLKIDVDTHVGMRDGVPRLLDALGKAGVRATFFLSFGPDNSGKAILNVLRQRGFLRKMLATGAPRLYGWRTIVSGTLLPARPVAAAFPEIVRRIEAEGHEAGVHAWDHRLWQDHLPELDEAAVREQLARASESFERLVGRRATSVAAPAWFATATSLRVQDGLDLLYASDMRGGEPCFPVLDGYRSSTLQIPTTQPCLEELLARGQRDLPRCADAVCAPGEPGLARVFPLHAEVEGGVYHAFLDLLLARLREQGDELVPLAELARRLLTRRAELPVAPVELAPLAGRGGVVLQPAALAAHV
jgi:undecaprenyl phosphate-alpha-L-ara4FN deformylase